MNDKFKNHVITYKEYHYNKINKTIHIVFIPILFYGLMGCLNYLGIELIFKNTILSINFSILFMIINIFLFIDVNIFAGIMTAIIFYPIALLARYHFLQYKETNSSGYVFVYFLILHIIGCTSLIIGHYLFEKRKPAVIDNPLFTLFAPFFVVVEILWFFGWKKEEMVEISKIVELKVKQFHENRKKNN